MTSHAFMPKAFYNKNALLRIASLSSRPTRGRTTTPCTFSLSTFSFSSPSSSSSSSTSATLDGTPQDLSSSSRSSTSPVVVFPWRHSSTPLPRLVRHSVEYEPLGPSGFAGFRSDTTTRFLLHVVAARLLNASWCNIILNSTSWETNLANTFACAFQTCVGCLFSHVFHVPLQHVAQSSTHNKNEGGMIDFDSVSTPTYENEEEDVVDFTTLTQMMEPNLLDLYQHLSSSCTPPTLSVLFQMQVQSAKLENLHVVPLLTRDVVHHNPALRGNFQTILRNAAYQRQANRHVSASDTGKYLWEQWDDLSRRIAHSARNTAASSSLKEDVEDDVFAITVVAQVSVMCKERFRVVDVHTGECIQGDVNGKERLVPHLVRFERVTKMNLQTQRWWYAGPWQITDWDDFLDGNIWY